MHPSRIFTSEERADEQESMKVGGCMNEVYRELQQLAQIVWPMFISSFLLHFRSMVSMFFLGHVGHNALAGGSLAIAYANITGYSLLRGLSMGMEPICGQAFGAKKWSILSSAFQKTILLLLLACLPISVLWVFIKPILTLLGQDPAILSVAQEYITFSMPDLIGQACLHPLRIFLRTQGLTKPLSLAATFSILFHIPINYFLAGYLGLGVKGVALASSWNTISISLGLIAYLLFSKMAVKPWSEASLTCFCNWRPLIALALPNAASICLEWWWYEVMLIMCGLLPDPQSSVAATGILIQMTGLIYVIPHSLGMGLSIRVAHELGAHQPYRAKLSASVGLVVAGAFGLLGCLFMLLVRGIWGKMFTSDPAILALIYNILPVIGLCELGNCPQTAGCGVLRGSARPQAGVMINVIAFYAIGLPVAGVAGFLLKRGFLGLWLGLVAAQISCIGLVLYMIFSTDWEIQVEKAKQLTSMAGESREDLEAKLLG